MFTFNIGYNSVWKYSIQVNPSRRFRQYRHSCFRHESSRSSQTSNSDQSRELGAQSRTDGSVSAKHTTVSLQSIPPEVDAGVPSKDEQWKALPTKQSIAIDADTFQGLGNEHGRMPYLLAFSVPTSSGLQGPFRTRSCLLGQ